MNKYEKYLGMIPKFEYLPTFCPKPETGWKNIKALWYEGAEYQGKRTKVFAYMGFPDVKPGTKVPAVVLIHGGLGHAYAEWVKLWNQRGYAALAMDTTGYFPAKEARGLAGIEGGKHEDYVRELYGELAEEDYVCGPDHDGLYSFDSPVEEQWMHHALIDVILAHNILLADERIDSSRTGICGISWGSVIATIAVGYDSRYAFAIPIYGSAFLGYRTRIITDIFREKKVKELWGAEERLDAVNFPVLWLCALKDSAFCCYCNSRSYLATKEQGAALSIKAELTHCHGAAWELQESYRFADCVLEGRLSFITPVTEPQGFEDLKVPVRIPEDFKNVSARLIYLTEPFQYGEDGTPLLTYHTAEAALDEDMITARVPEDAYSYYLEMSGDVNGERMVSTTSLVMREEL